MGMKRIVANDQAEYAKPRCTLVANDEAVQANDDVKSSRCWPPGQQNDEADAPIVASLVEVVHKCVHRILSSERYAEGSIVNTPLSCNR